MSYFYKLYGLCIESDVPLHALDAHAALNNFETPDVRIELDSGEPLPHYLTDLNWSRYLRGQTSETGYQAFSAATRDTCYFRLHYSYAERYETYILDEYGSRIWVKSNPRWSDEVVTQEVIQNLLLGRMLGILMRLRGLVCLHGNILVAGDNAFAILGASGAGKSTLTANLLARGGALLAEDRVVLKVEGDGFWAQPGVTQLRLLPDTLAAFQLDAAALEKVSSFEDKRYVPLAQAIPNARIETAAMPLRAVYVLAPRENDLDQPYLQALSTAHALFHLMRQRFAAFELPPARAAAEYSKLAALAQSIPLRVIHQPDDLGALPETANLILNDLAPQ